MASPSVINPTSDDKMAKLVNEPGLKKADSIMEKVPKHIRNRSRLIASFDFNHFGSIPLCFFPKFIRLSLYFGQYRSFTLEFHLFYYAIEGLSADGERSLSVFQDSP